MRRLGGLPTPGGLRRLGGLLRPGGLGRGLMRGTGLRRSLSLRCGLRGGGRGRLLATAGRPAGKVMASGQRNRQCKGGCQSDQDAQTRIPLTLHSHSRCPRSPAQEDITIYYMNLG